MNSAYNKHKHSLQRGSSQTFILFYSTALLELICPNVRIACPFATVGCSDKIPRKDLSHHITTTTQKHMSLLAEKCMKLQQTQSLSQPEPTDSSIGMTRTYSGSALQVKSRPSNIRILLSLAYLIHSTEYDPTCPIFRKFRASKSVVR